MKLSESTKWIILGVLVSLIFLSLYITSNSRPAPSTLTSVRKEKDRVLPPGAEKPFLQMLSSQAPAFRNVKRNVFQFQGETAQASIATAPKIDTPPVLTVTPALPDVRYLGFYQQKDETKVQLAAISNGGQIYVGGVGEILAGKYEVVQITDEFIVLRILATNKIMRFAIGRPETNPTSP
jgi:hypothetical protein